MEAKVRVRYGRVGNQPKNTLVTVRKGDTIYFGIARCRLNADTAIKEEGRRLAAFRARIALDNVAGAWTVDNTLFVHKSGVFGQVNISEIKKLLQYFNTIDKVSAQNLHRK